MPLDSAQALADHDFPPEKLLGFARKIAWERRVDDGTDRWHDLASFLVETALQSATRYDPTKRTVASYSFSSWLYDVMEKRVPDFYRRQSEGYADTRQAWDRQPKYPHEPKAPDVLDVDEILDELEAVASRERLTQYRAAASDEGVPLHEWVVAALDAASGFGR